MESLEKFIVDLKDSLERELGGLRQDVRQGVAQLNSRFDTQVARLERHAGLWQTGARWSSRMVALGKDAWAEKVDAALEAKDHEIADLRERLQRLERRGRGPRGHCWRMFVSSGYGFGGNDRNGSVLLAFSAE